MASKSLGRPALCVARECSSSAASAHAAGRARLAPHSLQQVTSTGRATRALHSSARRQQEEKDLKASGEQQQKQAGKTFRGQLYESTLMRVEREKQNQRRLARERQEATQGGSSVARVLLGMVLAGGLAYYAGTLRVKAADTSSTTPLSRAGDPGAHHNLDKRNLETLWADCVAIVGKEHVATGEADREGHARSNFSSYQGTAEMQPFVVVYPATTEEVSKIMKACHARRVPVTAYSGGTSLEGHFVPTRGGLCVDFARMDGVLAVHERDLDAVVQPAVGWEDLNEALAERGLFFPPDPGPGAKIGGMVGTGCSGTNAFRYGTMRDWVASLTVVLADGTVIKTRQRPRKSSAGYDLTRLFVGSEGTLGLVTEATIKLVPLPQNPSVAVATFPTVRQAADCVSRIVASGIQLAAVELLDDVQMRCINESASTSRPWREAQTLLLKFTGTAAGVKEQIAMVQRLAKTTGAQSFEFARTDDEAKELWSARKEALWSVMAKQRDGDHVWVTDVAVPISKLPDIVDSTKNDIKASGLVGSIVGHVGDGNFHAILLWNDKEADVAEGIVHRMVKRAIELEGTVTGEHGVGITKRDYLEHELGEDTVNAMRKIKQAYDPLCLLNCDKVVRSQAPTKGEVKPW